MSNGAGDSKINYPGGRLFSTQEYLLSGIE